MKHEAKPIPRVIEEPYLSRFWAKTTRNRHGLVWKGGRCNGYGVAYLGVDDDGKAIIRKAHRIAYTLLVGPIPPDKDLDHLCRKKDCIDPRHLEAVPPKENCLRGISFAAKNARKTHCKHGHPLSGSNLIIARPSRGPERRCRTCNDKWQREYQQRKALARV